MQDPARPLDGRSVRAQRTRVAIVDACVTLVEEGDLRPTAPRIAERAGVSVRSVFQHFDDLPSLHIAVSERVAERLPRLLHPLDVALALDERIDVLVRHRAELLEAMTPFRRAAQVHGPGAPEIQRAVRGAAEHLRREVDGTFAPELAALDAAERTEVGDALAVALSWGAWEALRTEWGRTPDQARAAAARMVRAILGVGGTGG